MAAFDCLLPGRRSRSPYTDLLCQHTSITNITTPTTTINVSSTKEENQQFSPQSVRLWILKYRVASRLVFVVWRKRWCDVWWWFRTRTNKIPTSSGKRSVKKYPASADVSLVMFLIIKNTYWTSPAFKTFHASKCFLIEGFCPYFVIFHFSINFIPLKSIVLEYLLTPGLL